MSAQSDFMNSEPKFDLKNPENIHDRVLIVGEEKFYVVAGYLASFSEHFRAMFYGNFDDAKKKEIEIKEVDAKAFEVFLYLLYDKSYKVYLEADLLIPVIDLSYRFLSPKVLQACKEYAQACKELSKKKVATLDAILLDLLETAYKYDIQSLKNASLFRLTNAAVICKFELTVVLECAHRLKIEDLKEWLEVYISKDLTYENCSNKLDFAKEHDLHTLKAKIIAKIMAWKYNFFPENNMISLLKSAFDHDIEYLKELVRERLFTNHSGFIKRNREEIFALPIEIRDFVFNVMIDRY